MRIIRYIDVVTDTHMTKKEADPEWEHGTFPGTQSLAGCFEKTLLPSSVVSCRLKN